MKKLLAVLLAMTMLLMVLPIVSFAEDFVISEITITDADMIPYVGETTGENMGYSLPEDCHMTVTQLVWYCETPEEALSDNAVFEANKEYDMNWTFAADEGYVFAEDVTITINGSTDNIHPTLCVRANDTLFFVVSKPLQAIEDDGVISEITITDANIRPVIGEMAGDLMDYTLSENCHMSVSVQYWYCETTDEVLASDKTFEEGKEYDMNWTFTADMGYSFAENPTITINGSAENVWDEISYCYDEDGKVFLVSAQPMEAAGPELISEIAIDDVDIIPYVGYTADELSDFPFLDNHKMRMIGHEWYNETESGNPLTAGDIFEADNEYDRGFVLTAKPGYAFAEHPTILINGSADNVDLENSYRDPVFDTGFYVLSKTMEAVEPQVISEINITDADVTPYIGYTAGELMDFTLPEDSHMSVVGQMWYCETPERMMEDYETFEADKDYDMNWKLYADKGYVFAENPTITINGVSGHLFDDITCQEGVREFYVVYEPTTSVEPQEISEIAITGADITPYIGCLSEDLMAYTLPEGCHMTEKEQVWLCFASDGGLHEQRYYDAFEAESGDAYSKAWVLLADKGYFFAEHPTITINGSSDVVFEGFSTRSFDDFRIFNVASEPVEAVELQVISEIVISDADIEPIAGETAGEHMAASVSADAPYTIDAQAWKNYASMGMMEEDEAFEKGSDYAVQFNLKPKKGYYFAGDASITINGKTDVCDWLHSGILDIEGSEFLILTKPVHLKADELITEIVINDAKVTPLAGETVGDSEFTVPEDAPYTVIMAGWWDVFETRLVDPEETFTAGKVYCACWNVVANEGYVFDENAVVTVNGSAELVDAEHSYLADDIFVISCFGIFVEEQEESEEPSEEESTEPSEEESAEPSEESANPDESDESDSSAEETMLGDANDDGVVDMKDVLLLRKYLAGIEKDMDETNADANVDQSLDMKDVLLIRKFLAHMIEKLG